jgi:hypothetical protein
VNHIWNDATIKERDREYILHVDDLVYLNADTEASWVHWFVGFLLYHAGPVLMVITPWPLVLAVKLTDSLSPEQIPYPSPKAQAEAGQNEHFPVREEEIQQVRQRAVHNDNCNARHGPGDGSVQTSQFERIRAQCSSSDIHCVVRSALLHGHERQKARGFRGNGGVSFKPCVTRCLIR